jgi:hypothetical protein
LYFHRYVTILPHPHGKRRSRVAPPSGRGCTANRGGATNAAQHRAGSRMSREASSLARAPRRAHKGPGIQVHRLAGSGVREATPRLRHEPRRISYARHDVWWPPLNAVRPVRAALGPPGCRVSQILHTTFGEPPFHALGRIGTQCACGVSRRGGAAPASRLFTFSGPLPAPRAPAGLPAGGRAPP